MFLYRRYLNLPILRKLLLWVLIAVILSGTAILGLSYIFSAYDMRKKAISSTMDLVLYENALVYSEEQYLFGVANYYASNSDVQALMHASNRGEELPANTKLDNLFSVSTSHMNVLSLSFYDKSGRALAFKTIDQSHGLIDQDVENALTPLGDLFSERYTYLWTYIPKNEGTLYRQDNSPKLCLWRLVRDNTNYQTIGALCIAIDTRKFLRSNDSFEQTYYERMFMLDNNGNVVIERGGETPLTAEELQLLRDQVHPYLNSGTFTANIQGKKYDVIYSKINETNGYATFALVGDLDYPLNSPFFWICCMIGLVVVFLIMLPITLFIAQSFSKPLNHLLQSMSRYSAGQRDAHSNLQFNDEIGKLGAMFNEMVENTNRLIEDKYELTIRRQAADLTALSVQINPHFIYNMLNMIQWTALESGAEDVAEMAYCTGQIFHMALNHGEPFATLAHEQRLLQYYLLMQHQRFKDRIEYEMHFDESVLAIRIPKLLFQPLVENSIIHGVDAAHPNIFIRICACMTETDRVRITVEDNGIGIAPEILRLLPDKSMPPDGHSSGSRYALRNISERLRLFYGEGQYCYEFSSAPGEGTTVLIEIPLQVCSDFWEGEGSDHA